MAIWRRRHHFIGYLEEEAPFYWRFERGGTVLLSRFGWRLVNFFYLCPKLCWRLAGVLFYGPSSTCRAGRLDQVKIFAMEIIHISMPYCSHDKYGIFYKTTRKFVYNYHIHSFVYVSYGENNNPKLSNEK